MNQLIIKTVVVLSTGVLLSGCLQVQEKHYRFQLQADGTMSGSICFLGIQSSDEYDADVSSTDFYSLVEDYVEGTQYEDDHNYLNVSSKQFWVEDTSLNCELRFTLADPAAAGFVLHRNCNCAPAYLLLSDDYKPLVTSNGERNGEQDLLSWPPGTTEFTFITGSAEETEGIRSLAARWLELYPQTARQRPAP